MKERTLDEWLKYYEDHCKLPNPRNKPGPYPKGSRMIWHPSIGYSVLLYMPEEKAIKICEMAGDCRSWIDTAILAAKELGCKYVTMRTIRNIKAWIRSTKATILHKQEFSNKEARYVAEYNGYKAICSQYLSSDKYTYNSESYLTTYATIYLV